MSLLPEAIIRQMTWQVMTRHNVIYGNSKEAVPGDPVHSLSLRK
ncbi:MAG: hypothetical protein WC015_08505 [Methanoregula sp.]